MRIIPLATLAIGMLGIAPTVVLAQPKEDWTGFYSLASRAELAQVGLTPDAPERLLNVRITEHLLPWAKIRMEATDGIVEDTGLVCKPDGIFRYPNMAGYFLMVPGKERMTIIFNNVTTAGVRRIYLNRDHPKHLLPTWNGHSIGRWNGEVLEIDSIGFNDKSWLMSGMEPHTEEVHMKETIRTVAPKILEFAITVDDRLTLKSPYSFKRYYKWRDEEMKEFVCNEDPEYWQAYRNQAIERQKARRAEQEASK